MYAKKTIKDYYQIEMQLLNEAVQNFAHTHPQHAARLNIDSSYGSDPHISRLMEGCAYLNARVKQQIDLGVGHVSEALLRQLAPQYLTAYPSMTIVQFDSHDQRMIETHSLPANLKLCSGLVGDEKTSCSFTTTQPLQIIPVQLIDVQYESSATNCSFLTFSFKFNEGVNYSAFQNITMPLFINSTPSLACEWYNNLTSKISKITLKCAEDSEFFVGDQASVRPFHLHAQDTLLPQLSRHIKAFELLSDYFLFQEKYFFIQLCLTKLCFKRPSFDLRVQFTEPLKDIRLHPELFKLHCVPARNVFKTTAEPIRYQPCHHQYPVSVSQEKPESMHLLAIEQAHGFKKQTSESIALGDFYQTSNVQFSCYYRLSMVAKGEDSVSMSLTFSGDQLEEMYISCDILAYNGHYPAQYVQPRTLQLSDDSVPAFLRATNLTRPSRYFQPLLSNDYASMVLSQINARFVSFAEVTHLKQLLNLHDWSGNYHAQIEAIDAVKLTPFNRLQKGVVVKGLMFALKIRDEGFNSFAELTFFGRILHHFVRYFAPLNTQVQTDIETIPSLKTIHWVHNA